MIFYYNGKYFELHEEYTGEESVCAFYNLDHRFKRMKGSISKEHPHFFAWTVYRNDPDMSVSTKIHTEGTLVRNLC
jgi:hypothetical protein